MSCEGVGDPVADVLRCPVGVGRVVFQDPSADQLTVGPPAHLLFLVERHERALNGRQSIERHTGKVVMLEVIVGVQVGEIPEPVAAHQSAPLGGIIRIDVVVLSQSIKCERHGEHEKHRDDARPERRVKAEEIPERRNRSEMKREGEPSLERNTALQLGRVGRRFPPRGAEVDREERRSAVEKLVPALVYLR